MSNLKMLSEQIARDIFAFGSNPTTTATRIVFMAGSWPDHESPMGGACEESLARCILDSLLKHRPRESYAKTCVTIGGQSSHHGTR